MTDNDHLIKLNVIDRRWWAQGEDAAAGAEVPSLKPSYVQDLERQIAEKDRQLQDTIARYREAAREFDEARVRQRREVAKEVERGRRVFLAELLEVVDNLERATDVGRRGGAGDALLQGIELVQQQFLAKLEGCGVRRIDAVGQPFDPERHEAISTVPTDDPAQDHVVVGVTRAGYLVGDEVLRPAHVAVAQLTIPSPSSARTPSRNPA